MLVIDIETRSACDLRKSGGHLYAIHPTTRLMMAAWRVDGEDHLWLPGCEEMPEALRTTHLPDVELHFGEEFPEALRERLGETWWGHNTFGFDALVWDSLGLPAPVAWGDSQLLAAAAGLPHGLDRIGERLWGEGKFKAGSAALRQHSRCAGVEDADPRNIPVGIQALIGRYNVQDVRLNWDLLERIGGELKLPPGEWEAMAAHRAINDRGCQMDLGLHAALVRLCDEAVEDAISTIRELTGGTFKTIEDLRKRSQVLAWIKAKGARFGESLRREVVNQWVERVSERLPADDLDYGDEPVDEEVDSDPIGSTSNLKLVARVLTLRQAAMRITSAKLTAAAAKSDASGLLRGLFAYYGAHTGRWAGRGVQVQNLPRPKEGVPVWPLIRLYEQTGTLDLERVKQHLNAQARRLTAKRDAALPPNAPKLPPIPPATPDDAASALFRNLFIPRTRRSPGDPRDSSPCLLAADYAAIEAVMLAKLAGEQWLMDVFWQGGDPYISFCEKCTGVKITKKDPRRQIWKVIELASGYQMSAARLAVYCEMTNTDLTVAGLNPQSAIDAYRDAHPAIAGVRGGVTQDGRVWRTGGFWNDLQQAALVAVRDKETPTVGLLHFYMERGHLHVVLPSQRELVYRSASIQQCMTPWGKLVDTVVYASPRWKTTKQHGGKWAENVVQATSRDVLAYGLARLEEAGLGAVLHVHDEPVSEGLRRDQERFLEIVSTCPPWLPDFPLTVEGGWLARYAKTPWPGVKEQVWRNGKRVK